MLLSEGGFIRPILWAVTFLIAIVLPHAMLAQDTASHGLRPALSSSGPKSSNAPSTNSLTIFGTVTLANSSFYADAFDRHLYLFGVRYSRVLARTNTFAFSYTPEIIPVALLTQPAIGRFALPRSIPPFTHTNVAYGVGANPAGFEFLFLPQQKIQPFVSTNAGFLYFSKNVPSFFAAQFNFAADGRAGVKIPLTSGRAVSAAYVFHHFSNGFQGRDNPGVDSQMIYMGYSFGFGRKSR